MGGNQSVFTEQELQDYQEFTFFTKKEIIHAFHRFCDLDPDVEVTKKTKLPRERLLGFPELQNNPFKDRIITVFSSDRSGDMDFNDFLSMVSIFSDSAPIHVKTEYAFEIYDFDDDGQISEADLRLVIGRLVGENKLEDEEVANLVDTVMEEADMDEDRSLSFAEFEHVMSKSPDFASTFRMRI